jgi:hypothetical protein
MKLATISVALAALVTGIIAAVYWYRSSRVQIVPDWPEGAFGLVEPGETRASDAGWTSGTLAAFSKSADLNAKAALWTAASVVLAALSSIMSQL